MAYVDPTEHKLKNGNTVCIRAASENDAASLRHCVISYIENGDGQLWAPGEFAPTEEEERKWIKGMIENPDELLLVAEQNGKILGNIDFHIGKRKRLAHSGEFGMSCMPESRGLGVGTILLEQMLKWTRSNPKIEKVGLVVISNNFRAIALYKKFGFVEEGRKKRTIKYEDGTYADDIHMALFV